MKSRLREPLKETAIMDGTDAVFRRCIANETQGH
jgi:hypothetical protein